MNGIQRGDIFKYAWNKQAKQGEMPLINLSVNGIKHGLWIKWYGNEQVESINYYSKYVVSVPGIESGLEPHNKDVKQGSWDKCYKNGHHWERGYYDNDVRHGLWESWHDNGQLYSRGNYDRGDKTGLWESWHKSKVDYTKQSDSDGVSGWLGCRGLYDKGCGHIFHDNGLPSSRCCYVNGDKQGLWEEWYSNGQLQSRYYYDKGQMHGLCEYFYDNGQPKSKGYYEEDNKHGVWNIWHINGQFLSTGTYNKDQKQGSWTYYYDDGDLKNTDHHKIKS